MTVKGHVIKNFAGSMKVGLQVALALSCSVFLFSSCEKKESPLPLPPKGDAQSLQVDMGSDYHNQIFVSLDKGVVLQNEVADWDIAFSNKTDTPEVWLNGHSASYAYPTEETEFDAILSLPAITGKDQLLDDPSGLPGSSALGDLLNNNRVGKVIIIKTNAKNYKLKIDSISSNTYTIESGTIDALAPTITTLTIDTNYNFSYFSFTEGVKQMEPPKADWDMVFTHYQHLYKHYNADGSDLPYSVTGVLLNPYHTFAAVDSSGKFDFNSLDVEAASQMKFIPNRDVIGFDWKTVTLVGGGTSATYAMTPNRLYALTDQQGRIWKLHFVSYQNSNGEYGSPQFEYVRLQ